MRVLKRPMFRKGGSTGQGIMTGLVDRTKYSVGDRAKELAEEYREILGRPSLDQFLITGGLNLLSGEGAGKGTLGEVATAYKKPTDDLFTDIRARNLSAKKMGIEQAQAEELKKFGSGTKSALQKMIDMSIRSGEFPDTEKGRADAFKKYSKSAGDITRASAPQQIIDRAQFKYPQDIFKEEKATFDVLYRNKVSQDEIYKGQKDGFANLDSNVGKKSIKRNPPQIGDIVFNVGDKRIYRYKGGQGEDAPTLKSNYEDITKEYQ